jgi:hypothetical protein
MREDGYGDNFETVKIILNQTPRRRRMNLRLIPPCERRVRVDVSRLLNPGSRVLR